MSMGVYSVPILYTFVFCGYTYWRIHIGVGFCVARSTYDGQCESLRVWDG